MLDARVLARLREAAARAFAGQSVAAAYAHGSRVSGRPRPTSDRDNAYRLMSGAGRSALSLRDELAVAGMISEAIGLEVDLRSLGDAPLDVRGQILEEGCRIYGLVNMARFRNRLVHLYWEVDDARVHEYLTSVLADLGYFAAVIAGRW